MAKSDLSIIKKLSLYNFYKSTIRENSLELESTFNMRIDDANRLYTVLNIPEEIVGEAYSIRKADIDRIADAYIKEFLSSFSSLLNSKGLNELYEMYEIRKVDKFSYLVVVGFSMFRTDERRERIMKRWLPISVAAVLLPVIVYMIKLFFV